MTILLKSPSRRNFNRLISAPILLGALPILGACQTTESANVPALTRPGPTLNLGVSSLDIIVDYTAPKLPPNIDHEYNPSPATQLTQWAESKLAPSADKGNLLVSITKASMQETEITGEDTLSSLFTNEQKLKVVVDFEGIFSFSHPTDNKSATLTVTVSAQSSISDNVSPDEAQAIRQRVVREALGKFDKELRRQLSGITENGWPVIN